MSNNIFLQEVNAQYLLRELTKWPRARLGEIAEINPRRTAGLNRADDELTTFVPMEAVDAQSGAITGATLRPYQAIKKGYTYFEENDVIFAKITPCMQNGKHAVCENLKDSLGFGSTEFHVLRASKKLSPKWLHYFLRRPELLEDAQRHFTGAVGQQRVPDNFLRELEIPLPPYSEQLQIISGLTMALQSVDAARLATQKQLAAIEALPAALLRKAFNNND
ncbi:MAG: restriction endonuclease subunit S [Burkholderiales bacterium]